MERDPMEIVVNVDILALDMVMRHLNVKDLLSCRLVSNLWNRAASLELRERSAIIKTIWTEDQLMELENCTEQSWNFNYAGLKLGSLWKLQSDAAMDFFRNYGARFTRLYFDTYGLRKMNDLAPFINHLPNLSILEFGHSPLDCLYGKFWDSATRQTDGVLNLSKVQTIRISRTIFGDFYQVLGEVLKAAGSPALQIELLDATSEILRVVKSAGNLGAVSVMAFNEDKYCYEFQFTIDDLLLRGSPVPSLTILHFHVDGCLSKYGLKKVLFASQRTLKELHLSGICLSELSVYKRLAFTKLTTLSFDVEVRHDREYLFRGRHEGNFPALKHLKLKLRYFIHYVRVVFVDDLVLPTVTSVELSGNVNEAGMKKLTRMFPNAFDVMPEFD